MKKILYIVALGFSLSSFATSQTVIGPPKKEVSFEVKPVYGLNTSFAEFSPFLYKQEFVFASDRDYDFNIIGEDNWNRVKHINIFKADFQNNRNDSMVFHKVNIFDNEFVDDDHVGPVCFDKQGENAFFAKINHRKQKVFGGDKIRPQLFSSTLEKGKWKQVKKLPFVRVNYSYSQPYLSPDGQKLYFASDAIGAIGQTDIFVSELKDGVWQEPKIVDVINSEHKEMFPTLVGNVLYFASDRPGGEGGLDIYKSELSENGWSAPVNLGNTINSKFDDFSIIFNPDGMSGYFSSNRENGKGGDDIYYFNMIEKLIVETQTIEGQFEYRYLKGEKPNGMEVMLVDDEGNLIMKTTTDEDGKFVFKHLPYGKKYSIKTMEETDEVLLTLFGEDSDTYLVSTKDGDFIYRRLSYENAGTLSLIQEEDIDLVTKKGTLNGQFVYKKLEGYPDNMDVMLIDEDGNIVLRTKTDPYGNFQFRELPMDKNYIIKLESEEEIAMLIFNKDDNIVAEMEKNEKGEFVYRKLNPYYSEHFDKLSENEEDLKFADRKMAVLGQFDYSKLDSHPDKMLFEILDKEGNLVMKGEADENGFFNYSELPMMDDFMFKISDENAEFADRIKLNVLNRTRDIVIVLTKDENGYYVYRKLMFENDVLVTEDESDMELLNKNVEPKLRFENMIIYYKKNSYTLGKADIEGLNYLTVAMKENPFFKVKIGTYASSPGSDDLNQKLTERRLKNIESYLIKNGVSKSRILGAAYGETHLVNNCGNNKDCSDEENGKNRRAEIELIK